ncbi:hypothetical protein CDL12_12271 [Handroanthus impetiginosus]|uniref:Uncharacterized protein n=1 Tax=Handroanthus impetiginosus TaxID=429701 RepID=A0A2G9HC39_9LAMI|nr:hypothetical protein CDL12_12271 [Handroanthus impetiginosus]
MGLMQKSQDCLSCFLLLLQPVGESLASVHISSIMFLCEFKKGWPCKIWIYSRIIGIHQFKWWAHHLILLRTKEKSKRLGRLLA